MLLEAHVRIQVLKKDIQYVIYLYRWKRIRVIIKNINYTKISKIDSKSPPQLGWAFRIEQQAVIAVFIIR